MEPSVILAVADVLIALFGIAVGLMVMGSPRLVFKRPWGALVVLGVPYILLSAIILHVGVFRLEWDHGILAENTFVTTVSRVVVVVVLGYVAFRVRRGKLLTDSDRLRVDGAGQKVAHEGS